MVRFLNYQSIRKQNILKQQIKVLPKFSLNAKITEYDFVKHLRYNTAINPAGVEISGNPHYYIVCANPA